LISVENPTQIHTHFKRKPGENHMEITENFIREKYNVETERKQIEKQIDMILFCMNRYTFTATYDSFRDFFVDLQYNLEKDYPQIHKVSGDSRKFLKIKMSEEWGEMWIECEIFQKQMETENETIARLIRREKSLLRREKNSEREREEKILLYNKLKLELNL
jgi:hypothetical protein